MNNHANYGYQFYPTPKVIVRQMCALLETKTTRTWKGQSFPHTYFPNGRSFLEPSAGDGQIADHLKNHHRVHSLKCIEIDPELTLILQGKGHTVIDSDFLQFSDPYHFDVIMMNPPFRNGDDHFLKAWDVVAGGGDVICLLPTTFSEKKHSDSFKRKQLQQLVAEHGEWIHIGPVFADAERKTEIDVSIAHVSKPQVKANYEFGHMETDFVDEEEFSANPLAHADMIQALVDQYNAAVKVCEKMSLLRKEKRFYLSGIVGKPDGSEEKAFNKTLVEEIDELKERFWKHVFERTRIGEVTTSDFQKKFYAQLQAQQHMAFSVQNIKHILGVFILNQKEILQDCLLNTFESVTGYHKENAIHNEGWYTNSGHRINKKIIYPYGVTTSYGHFHIYQSRDFYLDLDRVMCMLAGKDISQIHTLYEALDRHCRRINQNDQNYPLKYNDWVESLFFKVKIFKKGTAHILFKDAQLLEDFNVKVAQSKGWLGGGRGW